MPWNAAFATVLVATFVTVLWQREPVPDARLDGEARVAQSPAPAPMPPSAEAPPAASQSPAPEAARSRLEKEAAQRPTAQARESAPSAATADRAAASPSPQSAPAPAPVAPSPPPVTAAAPEPAPAAIAKPTDPAMQAEASGASRQALAARRAAPAPAAAPERAPSFAALDRWTLLNAVVAGQSMRHARGDTEGLAAVVNAVARSAVEQGGELAAPVEMRVELQTDAQLLAVLEIAGDQVRWTAPQGGASLVGTPAPAALAALRAALARR
jgi:hypothetical protein